MLNKIKKVLQDSSKILQGEVENMFIVRITYLDEVDEYGYVFKDYNFEDVNEARAFYAMKQAQYKDDGLVSVSADC